MADLVTANQVRQQLDLDDGVDEALIAGFIAAATRAVELHTGRTVADGATTFGDDAPVAATAVLLLVRTWYDNPDALAPNTAATELPLAVTWLLWPLTRLSV